MYVYVYMYMYMYCMCIPYVGEFRTAVTTRESVVKTGVPPEEIIKGADRLISMMRKKPQ